VCWRFCTPKNTNGFEEGEIEGKCFPVRRRTAWINKVRQWTGDDMNVARTNAMERIYDCW